MEKRFYQKWWIWVIIVFVALIILGAMQDTDETSVSSAAKASVIIPTTIESTTKTTAETTIETSAATSTPKLKTGIDPVAFDATVRSKVADIDTDDLIGDIKTVISGSTAYVTLTLNDLNSWSACNDDEKKEFINSMGSMMEGIGSRTAYSGTNTIGVSTVILSPSGLKLGERTIWGSVKLR